MVRVLIADDEPLVRAGIRLVLSAAEDLEIVAEACDGRAAVQEVLQRSVDVVLLDIRMPGFDGLNALEEILRRAPQTRVIILTTFGEDDHISRALAGGAAGFMLKDAAPEELIRAVRVVAAGQAFLSPPVARRVITRLGKEDSSRAAQARGRVAGLSPREREVLALLAQGLSNAEIGAGLFMSEATVKTYVSRVLDKLGCANRVQAALLAHDAGLREGGD